MTVYVFAETAVLWILARCLARIVIALNRRSIGVWTNPVYKTSWASLAGKQAVTVGFSSGLTWSCYSVCQKNTFAWYLQYVCLSLRHTRIQANKLLISQSGICGRQRPQKWTEGVSYSRRHLPSLPNPSPFCPSSLSPLDACYTGYVMPSGEGNGKGEKKIGLISKTETLHVQHTFFVRISLPLFCTTATWNFQKLLVTRFMEEMSDVFLFSFFFFSLSLIFTLMAASIPPLQNFMFFLQQKMCPFVFSLSL